MSDSLQPHGLQHTRPPCPSPTPRVYPSSSPLSRWYHPTISSSVVPFSSRLQSFPASGFFQMSQFFTSGGQNIGVSTSASCLPMNIQDWFSLGWMGWISLQSKGLFKRLLQPHSSKASVLWYSAFFIVQLSHPYLTFGKTIAFTRWTFLGKVMSLLCNMLSNFVITFLPRSKHLPISWVESICSDFGAPKNKVCHCFHCFPSICHKVMGPDAIILVFRMLSFKPNFSLSSFTFIKRHFSSSSLSPVCGVICISEVIDISPGNIDSSLCFNQPSILHDVLCI